MIQKLHLQPLFKTLILIGVLSFLLSLGPSVTAQGPGDEENIDDLSSPPIGPATEQTIISPQAHLPHVGSSPFAPPDHNDSTFVVDDAPGLDTGCSFRSQGPLVFNIELDRFPGDVTKLRANGLISEFALLRMPAFDVDFFGGGTINNPERDRVKFNGNIVPTEFLTGDNGIWKLNTFNVPIDWVNFPSDAGAGGTLTPATNTISIDIDTANTGEVWCTAIDWAALSIEVAKPVLMLHGILSSSAIWENVWGPGLDDLGIPRASINMGALDSIEDNAGEISEAVGSLRNRWGVDTLNIVSHSKGGLDSRHYVENNNTVTKLIQIATPNAGSPLADAVQAGSIRLIGVIPTAILDILAGPAGVQLTTPYMSLYNDFHGFNHNTSYSSIAGDYRFGGLGIIDAIVTGFYGEPNDTIVPVSSVYALNFTTHLPPYSSVGNNKQAQHTSIHSSNDVYNRLIPFLKVVGAAPSSVSQQTPSTFPFSRSNNSTETLASVSSQNNSGITRTGTIADTIMQGQTKVHTLFMDGTLPIGFTLYHGTGDLNLALVSPSGVRIDPVIASSDPDIEFETFGDVDGFRFEIYGINNPEVGTWTLEVSAPSVINPSGEEPYILTGWLTDTSIQIETEIDKISYQSGNPIIISAKLFDNGTPITNAEVTVKVVRPDESFGIVTLLDDGGGVDQTANDGIYSGSFNDTLLAGLYRLLITANGQAPTAFSREAFLIAPASASTSQFSGAFTDFGNDTDGDGLFNELVIDVGLDITEAAEYRVLGVLADMSGNPVAVTAADTNLNTGSQIISLRFDGSLIFQQGIDGPYNLSLIRLAEDDGFAVLPLDERLNVYTTASYNHRQFQRSSIFISGIGSDQGVDTNGNGLFDLLEIDLSVDVLNSGFYSWSGRLVDVNGTEIGFATNSGNLATGLNTITFVFDGRGVGENGEDGPYFLNDILIFSNTDSAVIFQAYTTTAYQASQFEGFIGSNQPPIANANGPYEGNEGEVITLDASGSSDPDDNITLYEWDLDNDGEYDDATGITAEVVFDDNGTFIVGLRVTDDFGESDTDTAEVTVNNVVPGVNVDPSTQEVQYSDPIAAVTITATDVAADSLGATTSWSVNGGGFSTGLPDNLALIAGDCTVNDNTNTCTWTLSGIANVAAGTYTVRVTVSDDDGGQTDTDITLIVLPEDATVAFDDNNLVAVQVAEPGGNSGPFSLIVYVSETQPDQPIDSSAPGDISLAVVSMSLVPVGPGGPVDGVCTPGAVSGSGYDAVLPITCGFDDVSVNTYTAQVTVSGGYYAGDGEDVLVVYDPSLGFTTGGGWFYWPDTGERTNFGFTMKYNKKGQKVQGNLLLIRHLPDGSIYRVKSNALFGLALGENTDPPFGWASFSGKSTYQEPGWPEPEGNHEFLVYVEDRNEPGTGIDRFWIEVKNKNGEVIPASSMDREATDNAVEIQGGNIVVPHLTGGGSKK